MSTEMKTRRTIGTIAALMLTGAMLSGCVYYPDNYGYRAGYYAPAPAVVVRPAPVVVGGCWGCGWHHWHDD